jgi:hypothetical protein
MPSDSHRLAILTTREIDELYGLPRFTDDERRLYFDLSATLLIPCTSAPLSISYSSLGISKPNDSFSSIEWTPANLFGRHEAGTDQPMSDQLRNPGGVSDVGLASRHVA